VGVEISTPATARNTDGVDPVSESDVTIKDDMISNGDDCVAVKANPGTPSRNITVDDVHCYGSHGGPAEGESPTQYVQAGTYNTNIVPAGPLGNSADDVTVTPIQGFGAVPACSIPASGPPPVMAGC
jgi:Glycosyl hydrolases family 28